MTNKIFNNIKQKGKLFCLMAVILLSLAVSSCATVQPWERGVLSKPTIILEKNPIEKGIQLHHLEYREGSSGATGLQSGGCGCG
jgi:hypothetical protein